MVIRIWIQEVHMRMNSEVCQNHSLIISREGLIVNPSLSTGKGLLIHSLQKDWWWENVRTPPKLGRYWEIHPRRPRDFRRPKRFPKGEARGKSPATGPVMVEHWCITCTVCSTLCTPTGQLLRSHKRLENSSETIASSVQSVHCAVCRGEMEERTDLSLSIGLQYCAGVVS